MNIVVILMVTVLAGTIDGQAGRYNNWIGIKKIKDKQYKKNSFVEEFCNSAELQSYAFYADLYVY